MTVATAPSAQFMGVELARSSALSWRFTTGTRPYLATLTAYFRDWDATFRQRIGQTGSLRIVDSRGAIVEVKNLTLLHEVPSPGHNLRSFVVADRRWRWQYSLVSRDYNVPKKTGGRTALVNTPFPGFVTVDQYDYKNYSLREGEEVWTPRAAVEDILDQLRAEQDGFPYSVDSFPIQESGQREFSLQGVSLRDQGDVALARLLATIPGADVWVDAEGIVRVINSADLSEAKRYFDGLPVATWDGARAVEVKRQAIRPRRVVVHYQREVEVLLEYSDNYFSGTVSQPSFSRPYIENVIQTVDDQTTVTEYDPVLKQRITKENLPPGTWVEFKAWLAAMDEQRPPNSDPWTFETIALHWLHGNLDVALGAGGADLDEDANVAMRIQAIKQHFRQTFRINRRLMDRTRDVQNYSVALLDPITGTRGPARAWGQACVIPSKKGEMTIRTQEDGAYYYRNVDYYAPTQGAFSDRTVEAPHGPTRVNLLDRDLGIFRLDWVVSPYGTEQSFLPCLLADEERVVTAPTRNFGEQDEKPMGGGFRIESGSNGIKLSDSLQFRVLLTFFPAAPNNKKAYHREIVEASDVEGFAQGDWGIAAGDGPELQVFVPATEATARFAWQSDSAAGATVGRLFGIDTDDPRTAGIEQTELPGYVLANEDRELVPHSRAVAAEYLVGFADSVQGRVATIVPEEGVRIAGNMSGATVQLAAAPSGKVNAVHDFPGIQKPVSRLALLPEGARQVVLGIVRFSGGDS